MGLSEGGPGPRLPRLPASFRGELLHRLELQEREVRALVDPGGNPASFMQTVQTLRDLERQIRDRLSAQLDTPRWPETRTEIVALWQHHRRLFERLVTECRQGHAVRTGRREMGPRW